MVKVHEARRASARPGQRIGLSNRQPVQQRLAVCLGLLAVTGRLLTGS